MQTRRIADFSCSDKDLAPFCGGRNTIKYVASRCYESIPYNSMPNTLKRRRRPIDELEDLWPRYVIAPDQMLCYTGRWAEHGISGGGVYFLWGKDNELLYVGTTCDLAARLLAHHRAGKIPYLAYSFLEVEAHPLFNLAEWIEGAYIGALEPPYNYRPGRCAFLGKKLMLERINAAWEACRFYPEHASDH